MTIRNGTSRRSSVLDGNFMPSLGRFDIVYAWGSLHHTVVASGSLGWAHADGDVV